MKYAKIATILLFAILSFPACKNLTKDVTKSYNNVVNEASKTVDNINKKTQEIKDAAKKIGDAKDAIEKITK